MKLPSPDRDTQDVFAGDDGQEATAEAQKLQQARVREAKQRAMDAKKEEEKRRQQTEQVNK